MLDTRLTHRLRLSLRILASSDSTRVEDVAPEEEDDSQEEEVGPA
jgi:hypothetical protein